MKKTYVIDTNVLIQAPYAFQCFEDNNLVIPLVVLEELDGLKKHEGEKGANARTAVRKLEEYRNKGDLCDIKSRSVCQKDASWQGEGESGCSTGI